MRISFCKTRWLVAGTGWLLLSLAVLSSSAIEPRRVLILESFGREVLPFGAVASAFRKTLSSELGEPVTICNASLEMRRSTEPPVEPVLAEYLEHRFAGERLDLVVVHGAPAAQFLMRQRARLFPEVTVLVASCDSRLLPPEQMTNTLLVTQQVNLPGMVEDILRLQPDTTNIVVIFGASPLEQFWEQECRREFQPFAERVRFSWLSDLSLTQMRGRVSALPPRSFILFGLMTIDAAGIPSDQDEALKSLSMAANAPMFGYFRSQLGLGTIGGHLYQDVEVGIQAARVAVRILQGEKASNFAPLLVQTPFPEYDWRQLKRWGISESRLPAGSAVLFRPSTFWQQYKWHLGGIIALSLAEAVLIIVLLRNRVRLRRAEQAARDLSGRLITTQEQERARLAKELHDGLNQNLSLLAVDLDIIGKNPPAESGRLSAQMRELSARTVELSGEVHRMSHDLHPAKLEQLGLAAAVSGFCREVGAGRTITVRPVMNNVPRQLPPDIALCLYRLAQEALQNVVKHSGARNVTVELKGTDGEVCLVVEDDGKGFDPAVRPAGEALGMVSMRERVRLVQGEIVWDSRPGQGTRVKARVLLPAAFNHEFKTAHTVG